MQDVIEWDTRCGANPRLMEAVEAQAEERSHRCQQVGTIGAWIRSRCTRFGIAVEKCARIWWCCEPDALVSVRTETNTTRGLVKIWARLPRCSSPSFAER